MGARDILTVVEKARIINYSGKEEVVLDVVEKTSSSPNRFVVFLNDCFKDPTGASPKQRIKDKDTKRYDRVKAFSASFKDLLNQMAAAKVALYQE
jgi:hypothetical protein